MRNWEFLGGPTWTAWPTAETPELPAPLRWGRAPGTAWSQGSQSLTGQASQRGIWDVVTAPWVPPPQRVRDPAGAQAVLSPTAHVGLHGTTFPARLALGLGFRNQRAFTGLRCGLRGARGKPPARRRRRRRRRGIPRRQPLGRAAPCAFSVRPGPFPQRIAARFA